MKTATKTYRLGSIESNWGGRRPLYVVESGETIDHVDCDWGPSVVGDMTEDRARELFPESFDEE